MHKVLVTFLPREKSGHVLYMDIHEDFLVPPSVGDFITLGGDETFKVVQVVHRLAQEESTLGVTVTQENGLPHAALLKSSESKKQVQKAAERMIHAPNQRKRAPKREKRRNR